MNRVIVVGFIVYSIIAVCGQINNYKVDTVEPQILNTCTIDISNTELDCE